MTQKLNYAGTDVSVAVVDGRLCVTGVDPALTPLLQAVYAAAIAESTSRTVEAVRLLLPHMAVLADSYKELSELAIRKRRQKP
jgi:hypothetical protein